MVTIYKFTDISTGSVYIGQTSRDINIRSNEHWRSLKNKRHHNGTLQSVFNDNPKRLVFSVICTVPHFRACELERDYIRIIRANGGKIMNTRPNNNPFWLR